MSCRFVPAPIGTGAPTTGTTREEPAGSSPPGKNIAPSSVPASDSIVPASSDNTPASARAFVETVVVRGEDRATAADESESDANAKTPGGPFASSPLRGAHVFVCTHGSRDARVTEAMTLEWARFHRGAAGGEKDRQCVFESVEIEGGHLFNREKDAKRAWLERVVEDIERELAP